MPYSQSSVALWALNNVQLPEYQAEIISVFCNGMMHIGKEIKKKAKERRIGPTELGRLINTSKQNVYQIFKKKSIDTDQLEMISKALGFDFFQHYNINEHEQNYKVNMEKALVVQEEKIQYLSKQNKLLTEVLDEEREKREDLLNKKLEAKEKLIQEQKEYIRKLETEVAKLKKLKV